MRRARWFVLGIALGAAVLLGDNGLTHSQRVGLAFVSHGGLASPVSVHPKSGNHKLESRLDKLANARKAFGQAGAEAVAGSSAIDLDNGRVVVVAEAQPGRGKRVAKEAEALGGRVEGIYKDLVQVRLPVEQLETLSKRPAAGFVRLPFELQLQGNIESEGLAPINAPAWHNAGFTGAGVRVAVLDLGFQGYQSLLGSELPASVTTHSCRGDGDITGAGQPHGTGVAEIVHDVAPGAELLLVNSGTDVEFASCVTWLKGQNVDIVNFSAGALLSGPGDGTGVIEKPVDDITATGVLWVNAAGNYAQQHWAGTWVDPDENDLMNFEGDDETNNISALAGETIQVGIKWDDPWGTSCNDYDLVLLDDTMNEVESSNNFQDFCDSELPSYPVETLSYEVTEDGIYHVQIERFTAEGFAHFDMYSMNHPCPLGLERCVKLGSLAEPADNEHALTVGAAAWNSPSSIESYSSRGPTTDHRTKPELVAPDAVSNVTFAPFSGTSAAAPHVAGAAALLLQGHPTWDESDLRSYLTSHAIDAGPPGPDNTYGYGRLFLDAPKVLATTPTFTATAQETPSDTPTPTAAVEPPTETPTLTPTATFTPTRTPTPTPARGDVNCDHGINSLDALAVLQFSAGLLAHLACGDAADVNHNGTTNALDAALILQYDAGLIPSL